MIKAVYQCTAGLHVAIMIGKHQGLHPNLHSKRFLRTFNSSRLPYLIGSANVSFYILYNNKIRSSGLSDIELQYLARVCVYTKENPIEIIDQTLSNFNITLF